MEDNQRSFATSYLLGMAHSGILRVQELLIQDHGKEALTVANDLVRELTPKINKLFYEPCEEKGNGDNTRNSEGQ